MLEAAKASGLYDDLILGDIEAVLAQPGPRYDLMLACDTMIYLGNLSPAFAGIARRLESGGFFIFSTGAKSGEGWLQTKVHRYRHSEAYLRTETAKAGLDVVKIAECVLRTEDHEPVQSYAVAVLKPDLKP
jgi:predicted TPR repeat methyltransferase